MSTADIHVFPILNPSPSSLHIASLWVVPVHQPQASSIMHRTWTGDSFHIWYYTSFNAILPNHPILSLSHRVQKIVYTSVSLLLSHIQGYRYHLSKFHIYALVYCFGVFLSGFSTLFSKVAVLVCIPTDSVWGFPFFHTLSSIYCLQIFGSQTFWLVWSGTSLWFWFAFL